MKKFVVILIMVIIASVWTGSGYSQEKSSPTLTLTWEVSGLKGPESAAYDPKRNVIYVSNVNGPPAEKNGAGFITKISVDGQVQELEWVTGLNAPKGLGIHENSLYVSDIDVLVEINVETGEVVNRHLIPNTKLLNDVSIDNSGQVYVSDFAGYAIYRLSDGQPELLAQGPALEGPNGVYVEDDRVIVASWGVVTDPETFGTDVPGHVHTVSLSDKTVDSLGNTTPIGNLDGVEADGKGNYFISDFIAGKILYFTPSGEVSTLLTLTRSTADIGFIQDKQLLLVPVMFDGKLLAYKVQY